MSQAEDIEAINRYITYTKAKRKAAADVLADWRKFHNNLSWYERHFDGTKYDEARNLKMQFDRANAATKEQLEHVKKVQATGLTTEELRGEVRRTNPDGTYDIPLVSKHTVAKWSILSALAGGLFIAGYTHYQSLARLRLKR